MPIQVRPVWLGRSAGTCYGRYDIFHTLDRGLYVTVDFMLAPVWQTLLGVNLKHSHTQFQPPKHHLQCLAL